MLRLRAIREARDPHMTLDDLADLTGIEKGTLSRYERGLQWPSASVLLTLARVLKIPVAALFEDYDAPPPALRAVVDAVEALPPDAQAEAVDIIARVLAAMRARSGEAPPQ